MDNLTYKVKSSDGSSSYTVTFWWIGTEIKISCDCKAGLLRQGCKHKNALVDGDASVLADRNQSEDLKKLGSEIRDSRVWIMRQQILATELEVDAAQRKVQKLKKMYAELLHQ